MALFAVHSYALKYFLYFHIAWFDIAVHLLGGFTLGLLMLVPSTFGMQGRKPLYLISIVGALLFSLGWEVFEYSIGMTFVSPKLISLYIYDTTTDVICGTLGGAFAGYIGGKLLSVKH